MNKKHVFSFLSGIVIMTIITIFSMAVLAEDVDVNTVVNELDELGVPVFGVQNELESWRPVQTSKNEYAKDVERLANLHLLPEGDFDWSANATWQLLAGILVKLDQLKPGIVPANLQYNASSDQITYADAAGILIHFVEKGNKHKPADGIHHLNKLGINVNKVNIYDYITGEELAHLLIKTLHHKQILHKKSMLEDVYIANFKLAKQKILKITSTQVEMEYQGVFTFAKNMTVFQDDLKGNLEPISVSTLAVGMKNAYLVVDENNLVQNIIVEGLYAPKFVRVLLSSALTSTGGSSSYDFTSIKLSSSNGLNIMTKDAMGDHLVEAIPAGVQALFTNVNNEVFYNGVSLGQRVFIVPNDVTTSQLTVYSTTRGGKNPSYDGVMEVVPSTTTGKLFLINELYMEDYLHRVVPSEMPGSWPVEALKVQAVAARSYAYNHILQSGYENRSANVDDSTSCQVYNNSAETANVITAVDGTTGLIMTYQGECINALFSSASSGYTANNEEVWSNASDNAFPGIPTPYTRALPQIPNYVYPDFNDEAAILAYFKEVPRQGYDYISPYYRWWINMTRTELENTISKNLPARENADRILGCDFVQTISGLEPIPGTPFSIGKLLDLRVIRRGEGGNIMILEIVGTNGVWRVLKEYNIRFVVKPTKADTSSTRNILLNYHTGTSYANYSILPSTFCSFDIRRADDGSIIDVNIYGGGNGHGVGMSQWGTRGQAEQGRGWEDILRSYYSGVDFVKLW